jgi:hypothetical protein
MTLYMISSKGVPLLLIPVKAGLTPNLYINGSMVKAGWPVCSR